METLSMAKIHACTSCRAKLPKEGKNLFCIQCLAMQHASSALGDDTVCAICAAFQPRVLRTHSQTPTRRAKWAKHSRQAQDIMDLKNQMAQILQCLARQQTQAPDPAPAQPITLVLPAPVITPDVTEPEVSMAEEDQNAISITDL
ncbi:UNVERIFIED_CONTAM: hypothetical protein FKN15_016537 [Acipenser sinensis]